MPGLSHDELEMIVGCCFRCGQRRVEADAKDLIKCNPNARICYKRLREALGRMDQLTCEACPDGLSEMTIARLKLAAGAK